MNYRKSVSILVLSLSLLSTQQVLAQNNAVDPVKAAEARNAALEAVSPVLDREKAYIQSPGEKVTERLGDSKRVLDDVNGVLDSLSRIGGRSEQVEVLLNANDDVRETLATLLKIHATSFAEAKREAQALIDADREREESRLNAAATAAAPAPAAEPEPRPAIVAAPLVVSLAHEEIKPVLIRVYNEPDRPAKVILKVGDNDPKTYFVGEKLSANNTNYTIASVDDLGDSDVIDGRKKYAIRLVSDLGESLSVPWE